MRMKNIQQFSNAPYKNSISDYRTWKNKRYLDCSFRMYRDIEPSFRFLQRIYPTNHMTKFFLAKKEENHNDYKGNLCQKR